MTRVFDLSSRRGAEQPKRDGDGGGTGGGRANGRRIPAQFLAALLRQSAPLVESSDQSERLSDKVESSERPAGGDALAAALRAIEGDQARARQMMLATLRMQSALRHSFAGL